MCGENQLQIAKNNIISALQEVKIKYKTNGFLQLETMSEIT